MIEKNANVIDYLVHRMAQDMPHYGVGRTRLEMVGYHLWRESVYDYIIRDRWHTSACIVCGEKPIYHFGHIHGTIDGRPRIIIAGHCAFHTENSHPAFGASKCVHLGSGCYGGLKPHHGKLIHLRY